MTSTEYPDSASRVAISLKAGRKPKISGQTSTAGCLPLAGCATYASQMPSGVLISTSAPLVSGALASPGHAAVKPAASAIAPNRRRDTSSVRRENSSKSSNSHIRSVLLRNHSIRGEAETDSILAVLRDHGLQGRLRSTAQRWCRLDFARRTSDVGSSHGCNVLGVSTVSCPYIAKL